MDKDLEKIDKDMKADFGVLEKITFISDLLQKQNEIRNLLDVRANIVIGFDSALILFFASVNFGRMSNNPAFYLIMIVLIISFILAMFALKPPERLTKRGQKESLFYHHYIDSMSHEDYGKRIHEVLQDENKIFDAYIAETYNLTRYSNIPRKFYLYSSLKVLIYGIFAVILFFLFSLLLNHFGANFMF